MYLKRLEIQGFKSFAKKTTLEFEKGIISVVGPNGSGKSNFADSIRWVLGEQSMKAIRSKKSEDVIFAGSDKKSKQGMAEVSITFDNSDRKIPLDFSEVNITRRLFRDGESEYLINKRPTRLMDIAEILGKSGYGGYSYHIISQGTIDQLILSGPTAVKTLIEEASGVKPYYTKRERALRKLERTEQNLLRVADLLAEIEPRLRSLRRQTKKAADRDGLQSELMQLRQKYFAWQYHQVGKTLGESASKLEYFDKQVNELNEEIKTLLEKLSHAEKKSATKSSEYSRLQQELRKIEKQKNTVQEDLAMVRGQLKAGYSGQPGDIQELKRREGELKSKVTEYQSKLKGLNEKLGMDQKSLESHKKIAVRLGEDIAKQKKNLERAKTPVDLVTIKAEMEKIYSNYQSLLYQIKNLQSEDDFNNLRQDADNLEIILVKLKSRVTQFSDVEYSQSALWSINTQIQKIYEQKDVVNIEIAKIEAEIESNGKEAKFYEELLEESQNSLGKIQANLESSKDPSSGTANQLSKKEEHLNIELQKFITLVEKLERELRSFLEQEQKEKNELLDLERESRKKQDVLLKTKDQRGLIQIERARHEAQAESIISEVRKNLGNSFVEKIKSAGGNDIDPGIEQKISKLRQQLESIGTVDDLTMQEYRETEQRFEHLNGQANDLKQASKDLKQVITELDAVIKKQFQNGFNTINELFSEYFRILFSGGRARMTLLKEVAPAPDEGEPEEETEKENVKSEEVSGVDIRVTPPGKKLASISALSGGERALTAIALLMAILKSFPSPFVVLDEVDAALDEANSVRLGKILGRLAHQTQFITITHNRETMRQSQALYGVTMGDDGISKVLSIKLDQAVEMVQ